MTARRKSKHPVQLRHWPKSASTKPSTTVLVKGLTKWLNEECTWMKPKKKSIFVLKSSRMPTKVLKLKGVAPARILTCLESGWNWWIRHSFVLLPSFRPFQLGLQRGPVEFPINHQGTFGYGTVRAGIVEMLQVASCTPWEAFQWRNPWRQHLTKL